MISMIINSKRKLFFKIFFFLFFKICFLNCVLYSEIHASEADCITLSDSFYVWSDLQTSKEMDLPVGSFIPKGFQASEIVYERFRKNITLGYDTWAEKEKIVELKAQYPQLKEEDIVAFIFYSEASGYSPLNKEMRDNDPSKIDPLYWDRIQVLISALNKMPNYQGTVFRYGDISPEKREQYQNALNTGVSIVEKTFLSTSYENSNWCSMFASRNTLFIIETFSGKNIEGISTIPSEHEILLPPFQSFKVVDITPGSDGKPTIIKMKEIGQ